MKNNITIMGYSFEVDNIPYEAVKPMPERPIRELECCCCGQDTIGRQWWNRDTGYGLCVKCIPYVSKGQTQEEIESCYGKEGIHYNINPA